MGKFRGYRFQDQTFLRLDLYSRLEMTTYSSCVERAVIEWAKQKEMEYGVSWRDFEHPEPGYSECAMFMREDLAFGEDEKKLRRFVRHHEDFFYLSNGRPNHVNLRILWPRVNEYQVQWAKSKDAMAVGHVMAAALRTAGITPPAWGARKEPLDEVKH